MLGWVIITYVPGVNYVFVGVVCLVIICDRWTIYLLKIIGDDLLNIWSCTYVSVYEPWNILMIDYSCLCLLIMIDVKLTPHVSGFIYYIWMYLWDDDMTIWGVCYISAVKFYCWNFYACQLWIIWRRDVYFLNIYYIRVIYRLNRNRALQ